MGTMGEAVAGPLLCCVAVAAAAALFSARRRRRRRKRLVSPTAHSRDGAAPPTAIGGLPPGWTEHASSEGFRYFHHQPSGLSTWEPPSAACGESPLDHALRAESAAAALTYAARLHGAAYLSSGAAASVSASHEPLSPLQSALALEDAAEAQAAALALAEEAKALMPPSPLEYALRLKQALPPIRPFSLSSSTALLPRPPGLGTLDDQHAIHSEESPTDAQATARGEVTAAAGAGPALPDGWEAHETAEGLIYYHCSSTRQSSWEPPPA